MKMGLALCRAPADPCIARTELQRRRRKNHGAADAKILSHQIPHLATGKRRRALRMPKMQQRVPQLALLDRHHPNRPQPFTARASAGTFNATATGSSSRRGKRGRAETWNAGSGIRPDRSTAPSAFRQPESWGFPRASRKPNTSHVRRAIPIRQAFRSRRRIAPRRRSESGFRSVPRIWFRIIMRCHIHHEFQLVRSYLCVLGRPSGGASSNRPKVTHSRRRLAFRYCRESGHDPGYAGGQRAGPIRARLSA